RPMAGPPLHHLARHPRPLVTARTSGSGGGACLPPAGRPGGARPGRPSPVAPAGTLVPRRPRAPEGPPQGERVRRRGRRDGRRGEGSRGAGAPPPAGGRGVYGARPRALHLT